MISRIKSQISNHWPVVAIFFVLLIIGLYMVFDYGLAWDEYVMRELGYMDFDYVTKGGQNKPNPFYGPITELPLVVLEVKLGITDYKSIFIMRHLYCFALFLAGIICLYFSVYNVFENRNFAIISALLLASYPVIFGHAFFNSKDIPFLSFFSITLWALTKAFHQKTWFWFGVLGIISGFLINARIIGLIIIPSVGASLIVAVILRRNEFPFLLTLGKGLLFLCFTALSLYATWPLLWEDPLNRFADILGKSSNYTFFGSNVLFNGKYMNSLALPRTYLIGWMSVTIPILVLTFALIGVAIALNRLCKLQSLNDVDARKSFFAINVLICFFLPLGAVSLMRTPLFDGWRHMFFLYLFVVCFLAFALDFFFHSKKTYIRVIAYSLSVMQILIGFIFIFKNHPHGHLYFNEVVSKSEENIRENYEFDYWGLSYKDALEYILRHSNKAIIHVAVANSPGKFNQFILSQSERNRLKYVNSLKEADFFISNYRGHPQEYPLEKKVYSLKVMNSSVVSVWEVQEKDMDKNIPIEK